MADRGDMRGTTLYYTQERRSPAAGTALRSRILAPKEKPPSERSDRGAHAVPLCIMLSDTDIPCSVRNGDCRPGLLLSARKLPGDCPLFIRAGFHRPPALCSSHKQLPSRSSLVSVLSVFYRRIFPLSRNSHQNIPFSSIFNIYILFGTLHCIVPCDILLSETTEKFSVWISRRKTQGRKAPP